jgi:hypothetical protein
MRLFLERRLGYQARAQLAIQVWWCRQPASCQYLCAGSLCGSEPATDAVAWSQSLNRPVRVLGHPLSKSA